MPQIIIPANVNLRTSPAEADNVLGQSSHQRTVQGYDQGDWYAVMMYVSKSVVGIDESYQPMFPGTVPYYSQWKDNQRSGDCGQYCVKMLAASRNVFVDVADLTYQQQANGISNTEDLVKNFGICGIDAQSVELLQGSVPARNSICLINYGELSREAVQDDGYYGWHWLIYLGNTGSEVIVHDPDYWGSREQEGAYKHYTLDDWKRAFTPSDSTGQLYTVVMN